MMTTKNLYNNKKYKAISIFELFCICIGIPLCFIGVAIKISLGIFGVEDQIGSIISIFGVMITSPLPLTLIARLLKDDLSLEVER